MTVLARLEVTLAEPPRLGCAHCGEAWPLWPDPQEFWQFTRRGVNTSMCLACIRERSRLREAMRRLDPDYRRAQVEKSRRYRRAVAREFPDLLAAYDRELRARRRAWLADYRSGQPERAVPCACGLELRARGDVELGRVVRRHQQSGRHRAWRARRETAA